MYISPPIVETMYRKLGGRYRRTTPAAGLSAVWLLTDLCNRSNPFVRTEHLGKTEARSWSDASMDPQAGTKNSSLTLSRSCPYRTGPGPPKWKML
jgi:hypothetical protein